MRHHSLCYVIAMTTADQTDDPTRERLVRAGLRTFDELPLRKVFAGATTAKVADAAGVTTGSFFHHFANAAEFTDALALSYVQSPFTQTETVDELFESLQHLGLVQVLRTNLADTWQVYVGDEGIRYHLRGQMTFWAHHTQPLSRPHGEFVSVGDILRQSYDARDDAAAGGWEQLLHLTGRTLVEPFTIHQISQVMTALFEGLRVRHDLDPESIDDELFGNVGAALASAMTVPRGSRVRLADLGAPLVDQSRMSPQARSGARRRRVTRQRITDASVGLFSQGWEDVPVSDVAEAAGVANQTVINLFGTVQGVAGATFARHVANVRSVASDTTGLDGVDSLELVLTRLAECAITDPEPARALLAERVATALHVGGDLTDMDIRLEVPLADSVMIPLSRLDIGDTEPIDLAAMLINFVLTHTLCRSGGEAETEVAALAVRLLPVSTLP